MTKRILFLLAGTMFVTAFTISCFGFEPPETCNDVQIINNSEYNITSVVFIDTETGYAVISERDDELIAKNGGSKVYKANDSMLELIVCVKSEDSSEFMCYPKHSTFALLCIATRLPPTSITIVWNGSDDPNWQPQK